MVPSEKAEVNHPAAISAHDDSIARSRATTYLPNASKKKKRFCRKNDGVLFQLEDLPAFCIPLVIPT